jgi:hypothetical protein
MELIPIKTLYIIYYSLLQLILFGNPITNKNKEIAHHHYYILQN